MTNHVIHGQPSSARAGAALSLIEWIPDKRSPLLHPNAQTVEQSSCLEAT